MEESKSQFTENLGEEANSFSRDFSFEKESTRQPHEMVSAFSKATSCFITLLMLVPERWFVVRTPEVLLPSTFPFESPVH